MLFLLCCHRRKRAARRRRLSECKNGPPSVITVRAKRLRYMDTATTTTAANLSRGIGITAINITGHIMNDAASAISDDCSSCSSTSRRSITYNSKQDCLKETKKSKQETVVPLWLVLLVLTSCSMFAFLVGRSGHSHHAFSKNDTGRRNSNSSPFIYVDYNRRSLRQRGITASATGDSAFY